MHLQKGTIRVRTESCTNSELQSTVDQIGAGQFLYTGPNPTVISGITDVDAQCIPRNDAVACMRPTTLSARCSNVATPC